MKSAAGIRHPPRSRDGALRGAVVAFTPSSSDDEEVKVLPCFGRRQRPRDDLANIHLHRLHTEVRQRTRRLAPVPLRRIIEPFKPVIQGWGNDDKVGDVTSLFDDLDQWIRMRLPSTIIRRHATTLSNAKMPNRVLRGMGLVSLDDLRRTHLSPA
ncbi:MAG TPA: group II intron maturase-specific domain-containing protein [Acidimicrobiales bacterium]|nr:group II intron maturase-specific domain-containing protein [Acidimicrobiales bacterium]